MPAARPARKLRKVTGSGVLFTRESKPARTLRVFIETAYCPDQPLKVEGNRVKDVLIVSRESQNRRRYSDKALAQLCTMYEGRMMNLNHPQKGSEWTPVQDRFSWLENVRRTGDGCRGDVCFNEAHPFAETFRWWAANKPAAIGLSHNAEGYGEPDASGILQIDEIERVHSVDIVADPATTNGLFESRPAPLKENHMDPELNPAGDMDKAGPEAGLDEHVSRAVSEIMKDETLDKKAKLKKIGKALELLIDEEEEEELMEDEEEEKDGEKKLEEEEDGYDAEEMGKKGDEKMEALRKSTDPNVKWLLEQHDRARVEKIAAAKRDKARRMCEAARLPAFAVNEVFLDSLCAAPSAKSMQAMIEDRRTLVAAGGKSRGKRPVAPASGAAPEATLDTFLEGFARVGDF